MNDIATSVIRTTCATILSLLVIAAARLRIEIDTVAALSVIQPFVTVVVYGIVRWLESNISYKWGWMLGIAKSPVYASASKAA